MKTNLLTKVKDLIQRERKPSFVKEIDLFTLENGTIIGVTGALGKGFLLEPQDLLLKSEDEIKDYEQRMRRFLNSIPEGITLHFIVRVREGDESILQEYAHSIDVKSPLTRQFSEAKLASYRNHPFLKKEVFLFVVIHPKGKKRRSSWTPDFSVAFGKKAHRLSQREFELAESGLRSVAGEISEGLQDLGFGIEQVQDDEVLKYLYSLLNPVLSEEVFPYDPNEFRKQKNSDSSSLRSRLLLSVPRTEYECFYLDGHFHRCLNLLQLPESTNLKTIKDFDGSLGKNYFLSLTIEVPNQENEKESIQRQGNFAKAKGFYSRTKDHDAIVRADESESFLMEIAESSDMLFHVSLTVMVRHPQWDESQRLSREALRSFTRLGGATGLEDHMNHDRLFLSFLPLQGSENPVSFLVRSEALVHLLPLQSGWRGTEKIGLLLKTHGDEPLRFDLFDSKLQAKHGIMLGSTGSGKSFFTNHLLLHFLIESSDHEVIVIDLGGSYRKLASVLEGSYLEVECSEKYALNPFPAKKILFPEHGDADSIFLQFLKELLQKMISPRRVWSSSEKMILERAIRETYRGLSAPQVPLLGDVERSLRNFDGGDEEDKKKAYQFAKELSLFTESEYGKILNRKGQFDFGSRFTVFDLRKISQYPELQEILLLIIPFALKRKFENVSLKKILVLDECWHLLKDAQGTDLIELFYRTARKFNGAVLSISQNPEDFLDSKIAGVMVNNSPVKYVLRLKKGHERLPAFGLNENEIKAVEALEVKPGRYSEIFIKFDEQGVVAKLEPNPLEYWTATTDALDLNEEKCLREKAPNKTNLEILQTLAEKLPNGVSKSEVQHENN